LDPWKIFKIDVLRNGISSILRPHQRVRTPLFYLLFCLWACLVCHSINIIDVVSYQVAGEGDADEQQPGGESMEAEES